MSGNCGLGIVSLCELVLKEIKKELKKQENLSLLYQQIKLMEHPGLLPPLPGLVGHRTFQQDRTKRSDIFLRALKAIGSPKNH